MQATYYHVSSKKFEAGEIKAPSYGDESIPDGDPFAEALREEIRSEHYSAKPSRLKSNFVWESLEQAEDFRRLFRSKSDFIYEVRFVQQPKAMHKACCTIAWDSMNDDRMRRHEARMYWHNPAIYEGGMNEVFAEESIEILRQIDPPLMAPPAPAGSPPPNDAP